MTPLKYSFKLLSGSEVKKIRLASKLKKENPVVFKFKKDSKKTEGLETNNKKRLFLKLAGIAGLGAVASLFFPKKAEAIVFGSTPASNVVGVKDSDNIRMTPAREEDGNLAAIKAKTDNIPALGQADITLSVPVILPSATIITLTPPPAITGFALETGKLTDIAARTAPFVASAAGGYVRQDSNATIAKETGGNLATLATTASTLSTDDAITYLRRIVRQVDSLAVVDSAQRQKITLDSITGSLTLAAVTTVSSVTAFASVDARYFLIDTAHNAYANIVRPNLVWS